MNSNEALTISQLAGRFGSRSFTAEMRSACGANESGLKKFLLKYPSLFTVRGNMVSLYDGKGGGDELPPREGSPASSTSSSRLPDVSIEMDAVQFFQGKLAKKEERWVPIRSLAGHISQASTEVRNVVGPQLEFRKWLLRHPHIFEVQGELVGLRDGIAAITQRHSGIFDLTNGTSPGGIGNAKMSTPVPPKTPPAQRRAMPPKTPPSLRRSHSFSEKRALQQQAQAQQNFNKFQTEIITPPEIKKPPSNAPVAMTTNEYKAVMYLKEILEKRGGIKLHNITGHFSQASDGVRSTIGWTKPQLQDFLSKHSNVFSITDDEMVVLNKNAKINVVVTGSKPALIPTPSGRTLTGRKGKIFHVAKLWGIVDLGKHEHVFFDKSIMRKSIDDLQKEFHVGETLYFNAIMAPKTSRAKWKATHVWREHESEPSDNDSEVSSTDIRMLSPSMSIEDEINQFLPNNDERSIFDRNSSFSDAAPSGAGVVPIWNFEDDEEANLSMVPESYQMSASTLGDVPLTVPKAPSPSENGYDKGKVRFAEPSASGKIMVSIACQTIATGDIIATQLYQEQ